MRVERHALVACINAIRYNIYNEVIYVRKKAECSVGWKKNIDSVRLLEVEKLWMNSSLFDVFFYSTFLSGYNLDILMLVKSDIVSAKSS